MISAVMFFFGVTLIYTGFLTAYHELTTGIVVACTGLALIVKPVLDAAGYYRTHFGNPAPDRPKRSPKVRAKKVSLKIVKSEDDRPTIH